MERHKEEIRHLEEIAALMAAASAFAPVVDLGGESGRNYCSGGSSPLSGDHRKRRAKRKKAKSVRQAKKKNRKRK